MVLFHLELATSYYNLLVVFIVGVNLFCKVYSCIMFSYYICETKSATL